MEAGMFVAAAALTSWTATAAIHDHSTSASPNGPTIGTVLHDVEVWWQKERADAEK
jgi:ABC-type sugar transport system substrate-binding protein